MGRLCRPVLQLPTGQFLQQTCDDPGAHGHDRWGQSKMNGGKNVDVGSGHGTAKASRQTKPAEQGRCRQTQPADDLPGTGLTETTASSWPASQQNNSQQMTLAGLSPCSAGRWREYAGAGTQETGSDLPYLSLPPIAFACHCTYPLP